MEGLDHPNKLEERLSSSMPEPTYSTTHACQCNFTSNLNHLPFFGTHLLWILSCIRLQVDLLFMKATIKITKHVSVNSRKINKISLRVGLDWMGKDCSAHS